MITKKYSGFLINNIHGLQPNLPIVNIIVVLLYSMDQGHDESLFANYSFYTRFVMECFDQLGTTEVDIW